MNEDKEELMDLIRQRMCTKEGTAAECFYQAVKEDPYLLKDLFQTFSGSRIIDAVLAEKDEEDACIGVWVRRKGDSLPTYAELYSSDILKNETKTGENLPLYS